MRYKIVDTTPTSITLWDGKTKQDPDTQGMATVTYTVGDHTYKPGDHVTLHIRLSQ